MFFGASRTRVLRRSEVIAETYLQTDSRVVAEIVSAHFVINGRFEREIVVQVVSISYLHRHNYVVSTFGIVYELRAAAYVNAVLREVEAGIGSGKQIVDMALVLVAHVRENKQTVGYENTGGGFNVQAQSLARAVLQV